MAHIYEKVVKLISKPPEERDDREVDLLIPWFQDMSGIIKSQKIDVTKDIVRNCEFQLVPADHVIIQQGEKGDCFYIILSGSVSVYINQALEEHDNVAEAPPGEKRRGHSRRSRPSTRARQPSRQRTPNARSTSQQDQKTSKSQGNETSTTTSNDPSGSKTNLKARSGDEGDHKTKEDVDADKDKQTAKRGVDSGCFSSLALGVDENDNDVQRDYTNNPRIGYHDVEDEEVSDFDFSSDDDDDEVKRATAAPFDRKSFGVHIRELGAGKCFGELALVQTNLVRTASIIADKQTNLLVINRELYNRSLKAAQQHEFHLKKTFVTSFPLFRNWTPRQRNVMAMSLTRYQYHFGNTIARQGTPVKGIYFITQGSAMVSTDTIQHINQYPFLCTEKDVQFAKDVKTGRETRVSHPGGGSKDSSPTRGAHHWIKRKETYAEKERLMNYKNTDICVIGDEDYIGDLEVILRLPTYCFSVKCLQNVDTFELDLSNFERQIVKKNPTAYTKLKNTAETKMKARVQRLHRDQQLYMPVLERMLNKLNGTSTKNGWKKPARSRASFSIFGTIDLETEDTGGNTLSDFRENQRRFLRHRQREKDLKDKQLGNNHQIASSTGTSGFGRHVRMQHKPAVGLRSSEHGIHHIDSKSERLRSNYLSEALAANAKTRLNPSTGRPRAMSDVGMQAQGTRQKWRSNGVVPALGNDLINGRHKAPRSLRELMISDSSSTTSSKTFPFTSRSKNTSTRLQHKSLPTDSFPMTNSRDYSDSF